MRYQATEKNLRHYNSLQKIRLKKVVSFPEIGCVKIFSLLTCPHSRMCIRIYIFHLKKIKNQKKTQKNTHTYKKQQKKLKKIEKQKKPKKKRRKKMSLLTISVENVTGYDDIV